MELNSKSITERESEFPKYMQIEQHTFKYYNTWVKEIKSVTPTTCLKPRLVLGQKSVTRLNHLKIMDDSILLVP